MENFDTCFIIEMTYQEKQTVYKTLITSHEYRRLRDKYIGAHPLCEDCLAEGKVTQATEVHHVRRILGAGDLSGMKARLMDCGNLRSLCYDCHRRAHAEVGGSHRGKKGTEAKKIEALEFSRRFYGDTGG